MNKLYRTFAKNILLFVVFITGGCVLVVEILATRLLAPYFGNTIYTVSSVISVILAALSLGYYYGGKYADRNPNSQSFYKLIFYAGLLVLFIDIFTSLFLPILATFFSITAGPLVMSLAMFFAPSALLGMLSPFAIKLYVKQFPKMGVGTLSGRIFFWSTMGSILGSLLSGFYLVPHFGISKIIVMTGITLVGLSLVGLSKSSGLSFRQLLSVLVFVIALNFASSNKLIHPNQVLSYDGTYERIAIHDETVDGQKYRYLILDSSLSSGIKLGSDELVFPYSQSTKLTPFIKPEINSVLLLGGGANSQARLFLRDYLNADVHTVEIEPTLFDLSLDYFELENDPRLTNSIQDGRKYLADTDKVFDLIYSDVFGGVISVPVHFTTKEFYQLTKKSLTDNGMFFMHLIGNLNNTKQTFVGSQIKTFTSVFDNNYVLQIDNARALSFRHYVLIGVNGESRPDLGAIIYNLSLTDESWNDFSVIKESNLNLSNEIVFTDDYAPVDKLLEDIIKTI